MSTEVTDVKGLKELESFLKTFPVKVERRLLKRALSTAASKAIKPEVKNRVPSRTGNLKRAIAVRGVRFKPQVQVYVRSGKKQKYDGWYANIVHEGAKPHKITKGKKKRALAAGGNIFGGSAKHPGIKPNPFMTEGLKAGSGNAIRIFASKLAQLIEREVRR